MKLGIFKIKGVMLVVLLVVFFYLGLQAESSGLRMEFFDTFEDWKYLLVENALLVFSSGLCAVIVGVAAGILMTREWFAKGAGILLQLFNIGSAIPTLAVLAIIMTITGVGFKTAFIGLVAVTILPIVKNTYQGISEVPDYLIEASRGQGMTSQQILWRVQLPNALYVICAGIRTGFAINVGTSPLVTLIAADSLGEYIFTGITLNDFNSLLIGAVSVALLAVITDFILSKLQYLLIPRGVNPVE